MLRDGKVVETDMGLVMVVLLDRIAGERRPSRDRRPIGGRAVQFHSQPVIISLGVAQLDSLDHQTLDAPGRRILE